MIITGDGHYIHVDWATLRPVVPVDVHYWVWVGDWCVSYKDDGWKPVLPTETTVVHPGATNASYYLG